MSDVNDETTVRALLAASKLSPSDEEVAQLLAQYQVRREGIELLHAVPEARYEAPGLIFTATPVFANWTDRQHTGKKE